ncbi:hypothetical protein K443DRAFT_115457, partial [Laccaria amethystina LaAM-08-1]
TYSEDASRSGCRGVGMAEPVGCSKNCLMLALVVAPFSYPHHSPQRWHSSREPMVLTAPV